jgi:hypothetical protein
MHCAQPLPTESVMITTWPLVIVGILGSIPMEINHGYLSACEIILNLCPIGEPKS